MKKKASFKLFNRYLNHVAAAIWFINLAVIPISLVTADLLSDIVTSATAGETNGVLTAGLRLVLLLLGFKLFESIYRIMLERAKSLAVHRCKMELYRDYLANPLSVLYSYDNGQAKERLNDDFNTVTDKNISTYPGFYTGIVTIAAYFIFIARLNFFTAVILTVIALLQIIPPVIVKKFLEKNYNDTRDIEAKLTNLVIEAHHGFAILKLYKLKKWYTGKLAELHRKYLRIGNGGIFAGTAENTLDKFISTVLKYGTYAIIGLFVLYSIITLDTGVKAIALSNSFFAAVNSVFTSISRFAVIKQAEGRLSEWNVESDINTVLNGSDVILSEVSLSYNDKVIFRNMNVTLPAKGICLIKGANGVGKSTLFKLITGLLHSEQGHISVGGINADLLSSDVFMRDIFYLPQEDAEFDFSPKEFYGMIYGSAISPVIENAKLFGLEEKQLSDTKINELSGGERKKVFLSLALAVNPIILLLDEPTNSLDEDSKEILIRELEKRNGLTLLITHDPIFDTMFDHICFISEGGMKIE